MSTEGRLKCFFGAAPGVGKTYAMLEAGHARAAEGTDVVVGFVETHGRAETARLLEGLEALPRQTVAYRGLRLEELDLDAALARKPRLLLVDELAHTNAPGARHTKRWQDVLEILRAGVDVYTTLNVQHVESLNDVVAQITGVVVKETVPDALLERAVDVALVDLPPDELLQRLRDGKIYASAQAERAATGFFRKGNLIALRELALRRTAERVDEQLRGFRLASGIEATWAVRERVLVSVGPSPLSARLVRAASRMARSLRAEWFAVTVEPEDGAPLSPEQQARVNDHLRLAESLGARTATLSGTRVADELVAFARSHDVTKIVVGKPTHARWRDFVFGSLVDDIIRSSATIDVHVIRGDDRDASALSATSATSANNAAEEPRPKDGLLAYGLAALAIGAATAVGWAMRGAFEPADIVMAYMLAVVLVSFRLGRGPSTLAALLGVAAYDFFFVPPFFTFTVDDLRHFVTFASMAVVALVVNGLAHRVQGQARAARERETRTAALYAIGAAFAQTSGLTELGSVAARHFASVFGGEITVSLADGQGVLAPLSGEASAWLVDEELGVAQWALEHDQPAGLGTDTRARAKALHVPLRASRGPLGVVSIWPADRHAPPVARDPARRRLLEAFAGQTAVALERALLVQEAQASALVMERERLLNALLSSVSHDLRTPLASITGVTSFLLDEDAAASPEVRRDMLETAHEEGVRLNRLVGNLLEMARLSAGALVVRREWQAVEEVIGIALARLEPQLPGLRIDLDLPVSLPLVSIDAVLIEQVLQNLLENAARHAPEGTPVLLRAEANDDDVIVSVDDGGPGVPEGDRAKIFERFYQGQKGKNAAESPAFDESAGPARGPAGSGLGLAICQGLVEAHGGRIWVERSSLLGGASFRFTLPRGDAPPELSGLDEGRG